MLKYDHDLSIQLDPVHFRSFLMQAIMILFPLTNRYHNFQLHAHSNIEQPSMMIQTSLTPKPLALPIFV
jgi:hypothetical protein